MGLNIIKQSLRLSFLSLVLALLAIVFITVNVNAQTTSPHQSVAPASGQAKLLHTAIKMVSGKANYVPNQLTSKVNQTIEISNNTKVSQTVTYNNGQTFAKDSGRRGHLHNMRRSGDIRVEPEI